MAQMGRPPKEISKNDFEKLCALQCTIDEVCSFFDVSDKTLNGWCKRTYGTTFSEIFRVKRGLGKISLRRHQWELAKTNAAMNIFLSKNFLGMSDNPTIESNDQEDDGFLQALSGTAADDWAEDEEE